MKELLLIAIGSALVNNVVLSQFLGLCPFLGVSKKVETSAGMGAAVIFVITIASAVTSLVYTGILVNLHLEYLQTIVFILVIAALVQFVEMFLKKSMPSLYEALGVYLPLITTNCAVLGAAYLAAQRSYTLSQALTFALCGGLGVLVVLMSYAGLREEISLTSCPRPFRGPAIEMVTAGLMALALVGFYGLHLS